MPRLPTAAIGETLTSRESWSTLEALVDVGNRMAGQDGEAAGAEIVAERFEEVGLADVQIEPFEIPGWWREDASLGVPEDRTWQQAHHVIGLPGSPAGRVSAPLLDTGYGLPGEFGAAADGAIVMARSDVPSDHRWVHRMEKYASAAEAGAVGFIYRNHLDGQLPATGEVGYHNRPGPIPAVGVSAELGARLARRADTETEATLDVACRNEPAISRNTSGVIGDGEEEVLVTAHIDSHDISEGASDNGVGSAMLPAVARLISQVAATLDRQVRFIAFGAEEMGLWGAYEYASTAELANVAAVLNLDGAGFSRDPEVTTQGFPEVADAVAAAADRFGAPLERDERVTPHGDSWAFVEHGVPAVTLGSATGESGRGWGHTHADTLDKVDIRDFRALTLIAAETTIELADADRTFPRSSPAAVREELPDGYVRELRVGNRWHFDE